MHGRKVERPSASIAAAEYCVNVDGNGSSSSCQHWESLVGETRRTKHSVGATRDEVEVLRARKGGNCVCVWGGGGGGKKKEEKKLPCRVS